MYALRTSGHGRRRCRRQNMDELFSPKRYHNPAEVLKQTFGYDEFRPHQEEIINAVLAGQDVLAVMPTSSGKSICYQVPALLMDELTLVFSPLISLMADQVDALRQADVPAAYINSSLSAAKRRDVLEQTAAGSIKLLYVAPERMDDEEFLAAIRSTGVSLVAVDEAHCISMWGNDFRPSYLRIRNLIGKLEPRPPVMALTATATPAVRDDICVALDLKNPLVVVASFDRPNLRFAVEHPNSQGEKNRMLVSYVQEHVDRSGIVYCSSRRAVEEVCDLLCAKGISATRYHAGLSATERNATQADFVYDRRRVMVATNAFGMGIDKSNVNFVIHYNLPLSLEAYYQEAGRAGRDGTQADCILLYMPSDVYTAEYLLEQNPRYDLDSQTRETLRERDAERLRQMTFYATSTDCLRARILRYFGEEAPSSCGNCSNCLMSFEEVDVTTDALKIASCVARIAQRGQSAGASIIVDILRGSKSERVVSRGFDSLSTYGIMSDVSVARIRTIIDELIYRKILTRSSGRYPTINLGPEAGHFFRREAPWDQPLVIKVAREREELPRARTERKTRKNVTDFSELSASESKLYAKLSELRAQLAREQEVPAYIIFSNATLIDMCVKHPRTTEELLEVSGVGAVKAERYGPAFLDVINGETQEESSC